MVSDDTAQRDFVAWWLLFGHAEYPVVWWYSADQVRVAMQPGLVVDGVTLPRLVYRIWLSRLDLQRDYVLQDHKGATGLLCWYRLYASAEYIAAPALEGVALEATELPSVCWPWSEGPAVPRIAVALWSRAPELQRLFDATNPGARAGLAAWYPRVGAGLLPKASCLPTWEPPEMLLSKAELPRPSRLGVNLVGFARAEFGLGEDVRAMSRALAVAGVDHVIIDAGTPAGVRGNDGSRDEYLSADLVYPITIFCMTAFDTCGVFLKSGSALFAGGCNIGYWPWELPVFPRFWVEATRLIDEIWAATRYQETAYRATCKISVRFMPPAVDVSAIDSSVAVTSAVQRAIPCVTRPYTFIYPFDPKSYLARKNPYAAVYAFRRAFPRLDRDVRLVLRVNGKPPDDSAWRKVLRAIGGDRRIRVVAGTFDRCTALGLLASSDCLVSPHRAEGFGRNIAEAIALGTPVIATAFSGSADYLRGTERLGSRRRRIIAGEYPFGEGLFWAEPNVAGLMKRMINQRAHATAPFILRRRTAELRRIYGAVATGERLSQRITELVAEAGLASI